MLTRVKEILLLVHSSVSFFSSFFFGPRGKFFFPRLSHSWTFPDIFKLVCVCVFLSILLPFEASASIKRRVFVWHLNGLFYAIWATVTYPVRYVCAAPLASPSLCDVLTPPEWNRSNKSSFKGRRINLWKFVLMPHQCVGILKAL